MSSACVTPDGQHVVTASYGQDGARVAAGGRLARAHARGAHGGVWSACVTPDGQLIKVTASSDKTARVWLLAEG